VFSSDTLELVADIPADYGDGKRSKVVGLVDAPGQRFVFSLFDAGEIWTLDMKNPQKPVVEKFKKYRQTALRRLDIARPAVIILPVYLAKAEWHCWIYGTPEPA